MGKNSSGAARIAGFQLTLVGTSFPDSALGGDPLVASERSSGYPACMKDRRSMLRYERDRPTNYATVLKVALGGIVAAVLLAAVVQEVVLKSELDSFEPTRTTIGLSPGAAEFYYDPEAVDPDKNRPDPREGMAPPTTDLLEGLPAADRDSRRTR